MNFFLITENKKFSTKDLENLASCEVTELFFEGYVLYFNSKDKFLKDRVLIKEADVIIFVNGIILNKDSFSDVNESWSDTCLRLYKKEGQKFIESLNGSFNGFIYTFRDKMLYVFNDQIGSKPIYYNKEVLLISTRISLMYDLMHLGYTTPTLSVESAYCLLSYGFMLDTLTLSNEVKKLSPGSLYNAVTSRCSTYFTLDNTPDESITKADAVSIVDHNFKRAIRRQFNKDIEYGFEHLVGLSGGLDSRMTSMVAHELGYTDQINFTFSQNYYLDETIAKDISKDLKHEWVFKSLDNGLFLKKLDEITDVSGGAVLYYGLAHGESLYRLLNFSRAGVVHTGQLGDVVIGTFYNDNKFDVLYKPGDGALSRTLASKVSLTIFDKKYQNQEIFNFYNRGFSGANSGLATIQGYSETLSPFYQPEMLTAALKIPPTIRFGHSLYKDWIISKHKAAARYKWEKTGQSLNAKTFNVNGKAFTLKQILGIASRKLLKVDFNDVGSKNHMNPFQYWYNTNNTLKLFINNYYLINIDRVEDLELKNDVIDLFYKGSVLNKLQVISLLSAIKRFFNR